jgi:hypothetical protein
MVSAARKRAKTNVACFGEKTTGTKDVTPKDVLGSSSDVGGRIVEFPRNNTACSLLLHNNLEKLTHLYGELRATRPRFSAELWSAQTVSCALTFHYKTHKTGFFSTDTEADHSPTPTANIRMCGGLPPRPYLPSQSGA